MIFAGSMKKFSYTTCLILAGVVFLVFMDEGSRKSPYTLAEKTLPASEYRARAGSDVLREIANFSFESESATNRQTEVGMFIRDFIKWNIYDENTWCALGDILRDNGYDDLAIAFFDEVVRSGRGNVAYAVTAIGDIRARQGRILEFFPYSQYAINLYPNDTVLKRSLSMFFLESGEPILGHQVAEYSISSDDGDEEYKEFYSIFITYVQPTHLENVLPE